MLRNVDVFGDVDERKSIKLSQQDIKVGDDNTSNIEEDTLDLRLHGQQQAPTASLPYVRSWSSRKSSKTDTNCLLTISVETLNSQYDLFSISLRFWFCQDFHILKISY